MSPSKREKEAAKRRHDKWVQRQLKQQASHHRRRTIGFAVLAVIVVVALVAGIWAIIAASSSDTPAVSPSETSATQAASPTESAAPTPSGPSASPSFAAAPNAIPGTPGVLSVAATAENDPCPVPTNVVNGPAVTFDAAPESSTSENRVWSGTMTTSCGDLGIEIDGQAAPIATASFVMLAKAGYFNHTLCHRVSTEGLKILQCGDPTATSGGSPGYSFGPIENAPATAIYTEGTIAMANASDPYSNGSQFFIVFGDSALSPDYTVLGKVTSGLDIVKQIAAGGIAPGSEMQAGGGTPAWPIAIEGVNVQ